MNQQQEQKKLCKLLVLSELLIQEIDHPTQEPTQQAKDIKSKSFELQELLIPIVDKYYEQKEVRRSNLSQVMQRKFEYIFNKEYKL